MPIYKTQGVLTGTIEPEDVAQAQHYLQFNYAPPGAEPEPVNMEQFLDPPLNEVIESLDWYLDADGHHWSVTAFALRELTEDELKKLASEVSGQNSDGLGEGFEQQDFAWATDGECGFCEGCMSGWECEEAGEGRMISFDWQENDCEFVRIK